MLDNIPKNGQITLEQLHKAIEQCEQESATKKKGFKGIFGTKKVTSIEGKNADKIVNFLNTVNNSYDLKPLHNRSVKNWSDVKKTLQKAQKSEQYITQLTECLQKAASNGRKGLKVAEKLLEKTQNPTALRQVYQKIEDKSGAIKSLINSRARTLEANLPSPKRASKDSGLGDKTDTISQANTSPNYENVKAGKSSQVNTKPQNEIISQLVELAKQQGGKPEIQRIISGINDQQLLKQIKADHCQYDDYNFLVDTIEDRLSTLNGSEPLTPKHLGKTTQKLFESLRAQTQIALSNINHVDHDKLVGGANFKDIRPPETNMVTVELPGKEAPSLFHANRTSKNHIATQAPKEEGKEAFFHMCLQNNISSIVNLTNASDKTSDYWPAQGSTATYGSITVKNLSTTRGNGTETRTLEVSTAGKPAKRITVNRFTGWPDHGVPTGESLTQFQNFLAENAISGTGQQVVHCRAGVGRTGVFTVLSQLKPLIENGNVTRNNLLEVVEETIMKGRKSRGKAWVQRDVQLEMILKECTRLINERNGDNIYQNVSQGIYQNM